jgi:hypothetical protein
MAATTDGGGYWLAASDGGVFTFGDAAFHGSMGGQALNAPVVSMATTPDGGGYWLAAADGGVFTLGNATFFGSATDQSVFDPWAVMAATPTGQGYWLLSAKGAQVKYGDATFDTPQGGPVNQVVVGMAVAPSDPGLEPGPG